MKVYTYIMIMVGMMMMFTFFGMETGSSLILDALGLLNNPESFKTFSFWAVVSAIFSVGALAGIVIGFFAQDSKESFIVAAMCALLAGFVSDIISILIYTKAQTGGTTNWIYMLVAALLVPFIAGYLIALVEYWRGSD